MLKKHFVTGFAIVLAAALMMHSRTAAAEPPAPEELCAVENDGAYASTSEYFSDHVDTATWVCSEETWVLVDISSCYYGIGRCQAP